MNKTIIININGIIFHIEEDAYELLKTYMTDVKKHFAYSADSEEIVGDIESRIAEMFSELLTEENKQVVALKDVEQVTAQMGAASDFSDPDEPVNTAAALPHQKKLFRDVDDRIIGGVCSGLAHYFGTEIRIVRLIALAILVLGGSGLPIYIILWLIMPKAETRAEKMAMKGEPINIQNFKRNFDEEIESIRKNFTGQRPGLNSFTGFLRTLFSRLFDALAILIKVFVKAAGVFIILIGTVLLFGALIALLALLGSWDSGQLHTFPFNIINAEYRLALYFSAFVLIVIPLIALILFAIRILFNRKIVTKTASFVMLITWLTGLVTGVYYGSRMAAEFSDEATFEQPIALKPFPAYKLELNESVLLSKEDSMEYDISSGTERAIIINGRRSNSEMPDNFRLRIEKSDVAAPVLIQEYSARGINFKSALRSAQRTIYHFSQTDSVLSFDWAAQVPKKDLWRGQEVTLKLLVPANTALYIDGKLNRYLRDFNLEDCQPEGSYEAVSAWLMTDNGLKCKNDSLYLKRHNEY